MSALPFAVRVFSHASQHRNALADRCLEHLQGVLSLSQDVRGVFDLRAGFSQSGLQIEIRSGNLCARLCDSTLVLIEERQRDREAQER